MFRFVSVIVFTFICLLTFSGVQAQTSDIPKVITDEALEFNQGLLVDMLKRDTDAVLKKALPEFQELKNARPQLEKLMAFMPPHKEAKTYDPFSTAVRITTDKESPEAIYHTRYELTDIDHNGEFTDKWAIIDLYSQGTSDGLKLRHFNFKTYPFQPTEVGKFEIKNKSVKHYIFLCLLIVMPIFIIFTIVTIIRNKHMTKKWLWALFSSFGFWGVNFNWITGKISPEFITMTSNAEGASSWHLKLISIKVLSASVVKTAQFSPFIVTIAFPVGAILYWVLKHKDKTVSQAFE